MTDQVLPAPCAAPDLLIGKLPTVFRIQSIARLPFDADSILMRATVFHERASLTVDWLSRHVNPHLVAGSLVSIRWLGRPASLGGAVRIARLVSLERPEPSVNPFECVPHIWVRDRALVARAARLWAALPPAFQHLFNTILWNGGRFYRYVLGPSSLMRHPPARNGNLRHAVEVAEAALLVANHDPLPSSTLLVLAALLHDAGTADTYRPSIGRSEMGEGADPVGNRETILDWIAVARLQPRITFSEADHQELINTLTQENAGLAGPARPATDQPDPPPDGRSAFRALRIHETGRDNASSPRPPLPARSSTACPVPSMVVIPGTMRFRAIRGLETGALWDSLSLRGFTSS